MASVYCGTYHKYSCGSIAGAWIDLSECADKDDFLSKCAELHKNEADPEFMFQDFEGFPESFYRESSIDERVFEWLALSESDQEIVEVYLNNVEKNAEIKTALECYYGQFDDNDYDFAYDYIESTCALDGASETLKRYFDYEAFQRDALMDFNSVKHHGKLFVYNC